MHIEERSEIYGGIDLGGTKIEACLFNADMNPIERIRIATPRNSYVDLLDAVVQQCSWLQTRSGNSLLPIGIGIPGLIDRRTGLSLTSNLVAMNQPLSADIESRLGRHIPIQNDCKCFALSEAMGGAGAGYDVVFGLVLGTGVGGGFAQHGRLVLHHNALSGEVGHIPIPAHWVQQWSAPVLQCGCGRMGCYETLLSGTGLRRLCMHMTGQDVSTQDIVARHATGDADFMPVYAAWLDLLCELVQTIQLVGDPDCIVLGGGVSQSPHLIHHLTHTYPAHKSKGIRAPSFLIANYGDSSGVRGAAILAQQMAASSNF